MREDSSWKRISMGELVPEERPICYGVLKPGDFVPDGVPLVRIVDLNGNQVQEKSLYRISRTLDHEFARSRLRGGELLVSIQGTVGRVAIASRGLAGANISRTIARAALDGTADASFVRQWMLSDSGQQVLADAVVGTTRASLNLSDLRKIEVSLPPLPEQRLIAEILDTVDEAIRKTEAIIAKLGQVKQGLLHDLLTRGIDENGQLRDPDRHPEQFKDSPLGRIPKEWKVVRLESLLAPANPAMRSGPFGSSLLKSEMVDSGVPVLGIDNVHVERFVSDFHRFITPQKAAELRRYHVRPRDVMITIMGTVGRCCVVPDSIGKAISSKHVWTLTFEQERYSPFLACLQINHSPWVLRHFARDVQGGIMSAIRSETLRTALLVVPPGPEQIEIENRLRALSARLASERVFVEKTRLFKQGLMDDLLTGRVRVTNLLQETAK